MVARSPRPARAVARRAVRRLHRRPRRPQPRAARGRRDAAGRPRPRPLGAGARARDARGLRRSRRAGARRLPRARIACSTSAASTAWPAASPISACRRCSSTPRGAASASAATSRSTCGWIRRSGPSAADLLRDVDETELADVIFRFGEERHSRRVARAIVAGAARVADRRRPAGWRRSCGAPCRTAATSGSIRRRGRSRRCASGSTASSTGSTRSWRERGAPAAGRRAAGRDHVSLARRPDREAHVPRAGEGGRRGSGS